MSGPLWSAAEIVAATNGRGTGDWSVVGVSIDSRTVLPGELFVALKGPHHDGHDFVMQALKRGAAALVERVPEGLPPAAPVIRVDDSLAALTGLGRAARARSQARIAAITGSVGKTGTKEALRLALEDQGTTHASAASHNNHWGVPLSLARLPAAADFALFELGMNAPGEIRALARQVRPQVALITNVEPAHLGFFPSVTAIAEAKAEIFEGLEPEGIAILNADSPHFALLRKRALAAGCRRVIGFGRADHANAHLLRAVRDPEGSEVVMTLDDQRIAFRVGAPGRHWVQNALAVVATAAALGADPVMAANALVSFSAPKGRGQRRRIDLGEGAITLIDESYNANPASVRAALDALDGLPGRKLVVLGDMLELGAHAPKLHAELAAPIAAARVERVFTVGQAMRHLRQALPAALRGPHGDDALAVLPALQAELRPGDVVLIKGSLGVAMGRLVEALATMPQGAPMASLPSG